MGPTTLDGAADCRTARSSRARSWFTSGMAGIVVFKSLREALSAGYTIYDRTDSGYIVRIRTASGWAQAVVVHSGAVVTGHRQFA